MQYAHLKFCTENPFKLTDYDTKPKSHSDNITGT